MRREYEAPMAKVVRFECEDIIAASPVEAIYYSLPSDGVDTGEVVATEINMME